MMFLLCQNVACEKRSMDAVGAELMIPDAITWHYHCLFHVFLVTAVFFTLMLFTIFC